MKLPFQFFFDFKISTKYLPCFISFHHKTLCSCMIFRDHMRYKGLFNVDLKVGITDDKLMIFILIFFVHKIA